MLVGGNQRRWRILFLYPPPPYFSIFYSPLICYCAQQLTRAPLCATSITKKHGRKRISLGHLEIP